MLIATGENMLVMRAGVTSEMTEDYVGTARAKGVPGRLIRDRHIAPNAILPAISRLVSSLPYLLAGLIIIERELGFRGVASLFFGAFEAADVPVIVGVEHDEVQEPIAELAAHWKKAGASELVIHDVGPDDLERVLGLV